MGFEPEQVRAFAAGACQPCRLPFAAASARASAVVSQGAAVGLRADLCSSQFMGDSKFCLLSRSCGIATGPCILLECSCCILLYGDGGPRGWLRRQGA